jgi:hypothetical protein
MNHNPKSPINKKPTNHIVLDLQKSYIDAKSFVKFALGELAPTLAPW